MAGIELATAYISIVSSTKGLGKSITDELDNAGRDAQKAGDEAGESFSSSFGGVVGKGLLVAGAAIGATFGALLVGGMKQQSADADMAASLGLTPERTAELGSVAGRVYAGNFGESMEQVRDGVGAVSQALAQFGITGAGDIEAATGKALNLSSVLGVEVTDAASLAGKLVKTGLATDMTQAFDIITAGGQATAVGMRGDLVDAATEYGGQLAQLGFTGSEAFGLLSKASAGGAIQLDKVGDALKEFTIRSTDMSSTSVAAYQSLGLNATDMSNAILAGGSTAKGATDQIVAGLLGITDPATQASTAIALFGTPLEDIGTDQIPEFLSNLQNAGTVLGDTAGAADAMGAVLSNTLAAQLEQTKRMVSTTAATIGANFMPALTTAATALNTALAPALQNAAGAVSLLFSGDFDPTKFSGLEEDSPVVNGLFKIREYAGLAAGSIQILVGNTEAGLSAFPDDNAFTTGLFNINRAAQDAGGALKILATGNFDGLNFFEEDSPFVNGLFAAREKAIGLANTLSGQLKSSFSGLGDAVKPALKTIGDSFSTAFETAKPALMTAGSSILGGLSELIKQYGPTISSLLGSLGQTFSAVFTGLGPVIAQLGPVIGQLIPLLNPVGFVLKALAPLLPQLADAVGQVAIAIGTALGQALAAVAPLLPVIAGLFAQIASVIAEGLVTAVLGLMPIVTALAGVFTTLMPTLAALIQSLLPPLMGLFVAIVPLVQAVVAVVADLAVFLGQVLPPIIAALLPVVEVVFTTIAAVVGAAINVVKAVIEVVTAAISGNWSGVWTGIGNVVSAAWEYIKAVVDGALSIVKSVLSAAWDLISQVASAAWNGIKGAITGPIDAVKGLLAPILDTLSGFLSGIWSAIQSAASTAWNIVRDYIWLPIQNAYSKVVEWLTNIKNKAQGIWNDIKSIFQQSISINVDGADLLGVKVPGAATGAVVSPSPGGTLYTVGEAGETEIISPVGMMRQTVKDVIANTRVKVDPISTSVAPVSSSRSWGDYPMQVTIHNEGADLSAETVNRAIAEARRLAPYAVA